MQFFGLSTCIGAGRIWDLQYNDAYVQVGTYAGELHWLNMETAIDESSITCHNAMVKSVEQSADGQLLLTSSMFVRPYSTLWRLADTQESIHEFDEVSGRASESPLSSRLACCRPPT